MTPSEQTAHEIRKTHNFQLKRGYKANYACTYCGVEMIGDSRAGQPCKNANLFVINEELNLLPWEPPLRTAHESGNARSAEMAGQRSTVESGKFEFDRSGFGDEDN